MGEERVEQEFVRDTRETVCHPLYRGVGEEERGVGEEGAVVRREERGVGEEGAVGEEGGEGGG